jgi:hypothetical protein
MARDRRLLFASNISVKTPIGLAGAVCVSGASVSNSEWLWPPHFTIKAWIMSALSAIVYALIATGEGEPVHAVIDGMALRPGLTDDSDPPRAKRPLAEGAAVLAGAAMGRFPGDAGRPHPARSRARV